jgi:hypothetical protein
MPTNRGETNRAAVMTKSSIDERGEGHKSSRGIARNAVTRDGAVTRISTARNLHTVVLRDHIHQTAENVTTFFPGFRPRRRRDPARGSPGHPATPLRGQNILFCSNRVFPKVVQCAIIMIGDLTAGFETAPPAMSSAKKDAVEEVFGDSRALRIFHYPPHQRPGCRRATTQTRERQAAQVASQFPGFESPKVETTRSIVANSSAARTGFER